MSWAWARHWPSASIGKRTGGCPSSLCRQGPGGAGGVHQDSVPVLSGRKAGSRGRCRLRVPEPVREVSWEESRLQGSRTERAPLEKARRNLGKGWPEGFVPNRGGSCSRAGTTTAQGGSGRWDLRGGTSVLLGAPGAPVQVPGPAPAGRAAVRVPWGNPLPEDPSSPALGEACLDHYCSSTCPGHTPVTRAAVPAGPLHSTGHSCTLTFWGRLSG